MFASIKRFVKYLLHCIDQLADQGEFCKKLPLKSQVYFYSGKQIYIGVIMHYDPDDKHDIHFMYENKPWHIILSHNAVIPCCMELQST